MWSCKKTCYCEKDKASFGLSWVAFKSSPTNDLWRLASHPTATGGSRSTLFIQLCEYAREACLWSGKCATVCQVYFGAFLWCVISFFLLIWAVVLFHLPNVRKDLFDIFLYFSYPTFPLFFLLFLRGEELLRVLPFILWASSIVLFYDLGLWATSALNTRPWTVRLIRKAKWHQVKGSGLCCGEKLGMMNHQEQ